MTPFPRPRPAALAALCAAFALVGCGDGAPKPPAAPVSRFSDAEFVRRFHAGVVELEQHRFLDAAKTFGELTQDRPGNLAAWINLAEAELNRNTPESHPLVEAAVKGALAVDPDDPQAHFIRGILHKHLGEFEQAEARFRAALKKAPSDPTLNYQLATVLPPERSAEAITLLETCLAGQTHLSSAYYRLAEVKGRTDREARTAALAAFKTFEDAETGNKAGIVYTEMGRLGEANRDPGVALPAPAALPAVGSYAPAAALPGRVAAVAATGPVIVAKETAQAQTADWNQDGAEDLTTLVGGKIQVRRGLDAAGEALALPEGLAPATAFTWSDVDQDADLDLVVARYDGSVACGLNLRDGKDGFAAYDPATWLGGRIRSELPRLPAAAVAVAASDLDGDGDPDLLFAGPFGLRLWRNDRLMRFVDATEAAGLAGLPACRAFLAEDLNGDRAFDVVALGVDGRPFVFVQSIRGSFTLTFAKAAGALEPFAPIHALRAADLDLDGEEDLVIAAADRLLVAPRGAAAVAAGRPLDGAKTLTFDRARTVIVADLNGDCALDLVVGDAEGRSWRVDAAAPPAGRHALAIRLQGRIEPAKMRANTGGVGARVETTAGGRTRVREVRAGDGMPGQAPLALHFGLGEAGVADYVRVSWPDDVLQIEGPVPAGPCGAPKIIEENQRKASSCPLVFVWNGERYEFVTDFLGVGGLGFLLEPGVYAPPDPTERLLLPPIAPRDGRLDLVIHEPFEEVCYLDRAALLVVDHPADVEIVPDERFAVNAPAPDGRLFAVRDRLYPVAATDGRGRDVLAATARVDRTYASAEPDPRFLGWAEPTVFTFDFGAGFAAWAGRDDAVLALDGWVEYPYSHIVLAAAQRRLKLEPLSVDVETPDGGFVALAADAAYPAGMPRTMTLPLPKLPTRLTGKVRLRTNQELHIDRLSLFVPVDVPVRVVALEPTAAELRSAGFPREYSPDGKAPRLYDYDVMDKSLQFKTLAGAFTRFGDVRELLGAPDDRYVVFAGGEEIRLSYAAPPPPAAGMRRSFVLDSVGWCKDMDPHTAAPYTVEPLPFLGMSGYPYDPAERFPSTPAHEEWATRYQTRVLPGTRAGR